MFKKISSLLTIIVSLCSFAVALQIDETQVIEAGDTITVDYIGTTAKDNKVFDTSIESVAKENSMWQTGRDYNQLLIFKVGAGQMIPGFDKGVVGMKLNETKKITLAPADAYGERDPKNIQAIPLTQLPPKPNNASYVAGDELMSMMGSVKIVSISGTDAMIDMNHQLAGETLIFEVTIKKIDKTQATEQITAETIPTNITKTKKPVVELFVMSYCPYGTQAEKGFLEVMSKFGTKADIKIKFVHYLMHGAKERDENTRQRCIQKDQKAKYPKYLSCFLNAGDSKTCLKTAKIDLTRLNGCTKLMNDRYNIMDDFANGGQYPKYGINATESEKFGVQGSPTLVINGKIVENIGRSANDYKEAICTAFAKKPALCNKEFSKTVYNPGFGWTSNGSTANAACGN